MGAQRAIFAADAVEPEPLEYSADREKSEPRSTVELTDEAIRQRSQEIWQREGCPEGRSQDHWMRARAELAELMEKTSNAQLAPSRPQDDVVGPTLVPACTVVPETSQSTENAAALVSQDEVLHDDVETDPEALSEQGAASARTSDESVSADPRPLRVPLTKRSKPTAVVPSIICAGIVLQGRLESPGEIQFDGAMEGDIHCAGLAVGEEAFIQGDVTANDVTVRGRIRGRVRAHNVRLFSGSYVEGDILYGTLAIETGAQLDGSFKRLEDPLAREIAPDETDVFTAI